jgi:hypothetical protein
MNVKFHGMEIVKGIKIFVLKGFGVIYVKSITEEWCGILIIHRKVKKYLCKQKHRFS